jgi:hypothetical protein
MENLRNDNLKVGSIMADIMEKINLNDLTTASFAYYIISYSDEGWADKSYKKFFVDCKSNLSNYLEKNDKKCVEEIVESVVGFLKSWHSLRAGGIEFEREFKQFLLRDENNSKLNFFSNKVFTNSVEEDFKNAGKLFESLEYVRGVGPTNSSKILHLFSPDFFVMWDKEIRETVSRHTNYKEGDYALFLKDMKERISGLNNSELDGLLVKLKPLEIEGVKKTIPKLIDEYNLSP